MTDATIKKMSVLDQCRTAWQKKNRHATVAGFILGGFMPIASYVVSHNEIEKTSHVLAQMPTYLVTGGLIFSAVTVFNWSAVAFRSKVKAFGFVVLVEGVMTLSQVKLLAFAALLMLIVINGIATGCHLSLDKKEAK